MQSVSSRDSGTSRRARVSCPKCGEQVNLSHMRAHLRDAHGVGSVELENSYLTARRSARRVTRAIRR